MLEMKRLLSDGKNYILSATFIFLLGSWIGYLFSHFFEAMILEMLEQLQDIKNLLDGKSIFYMAWFIFTNNTQAALIMLGMGSIFFLIPLFSLFANGLALGYVLKMASHGGMSPFKMFLFGILPHGILELPAILIAGGIGIFLGLRLIVWLFGKGQFFAHLVGSQRGGAGEFWREKSLPILISRIQGVAYLIMLLILTLFVAALVESFVTPLFIQVFVPLPS